MSGLLDSLSSAASALNAQRMGLDVAGQNLANINTVGYARRSLQLEERPTGLDGLGTGVNVAGVTALRDQFVEARIQTERGGLAYDQAVAGALSIVETGLGSPGTSLDAAVSSFFDGFSSLAQDPGSTANRDVVVSRGQALTQAFADLAAQFSSAQQLSDAAIKGAVDQVNTLAAQIAKLNGQIAAGLGSDVSALVDQRTLATNKLADLVGATVTNDTDGSISVTAGKGRPLVIGNTAFALTIGQSAGTGLSTIQSEGVDVTPEFTGGQVGGLLQVRDTLVPKYQGQLDQFAYDLATTVNAVHVTGFGSGGGTNQNFFAPPAGVAGAASSIAVDAAVAADSSLVAASSSGTAGDNGTAAALAALRNASPGPSGSSPADAWAQLVYRVGADSADATNSKTTRQQIVNQLGALRDAVSGVSSDEEAANLMKFQRAYEANARYFVTISQTLDALMAMVT
jgi:flagellar hook-associated protein 1 FlgK